MFSVYSLLSVWKVSCGPIKFTREIPKSRYPEPFVAEEYYPDYFFFPFFLFFLFFFVFKDTPKHPNFLVHFLVLLDLLSGTCSTDKGLNKDTDKGLISSILIPWSMTFCLILWLSWRSLEAKTIAFPFCDTAADTNISCFRNSGEAYRRASPLW